MTQENSQNNDYQWIVFVAILISAIFIGLYFWKFFGNFSDKQSDWGTFGDYLSGIFQFITVGGLLLTIYIQNETLKTTKLELKESTKALNNQVQESRQKLQTDIFFNLLNQYLESYQNINNPPFANEQKRGEAYLKELILNRVWCKYVEKYSRHLSPLNNDEKEEEALLKQLALEFADEKNVFNSHFKKLSSMLAFLEKNNNGDLKQVLVNSITGWEKIIIAYFYIFPEKNEDKLLLQQIEKTKILSFSSTDAKLLLSAKLPDKNRKIHNIDEHFHLNILMNKGLIIYG